VKWKYDSQNKNSIEIYEEKFDKFS
jgi:hypothetical protein